MINFISNHAWLEIGQTTVPWYQLHGSSDIHVPVQNSTQLLQSPRHKHDLLSITNCWLIHLSQLFNGFKQQKSWSFSVWFSHTGFAQRFWSLFVIRKGPSPSYTSRCFVVSWCKHVVAFGIFPHKRIDFKVACKNDQISILGLLGPYFLKSNYVCRYMISAILRSCRSDISL